jgi:hypothetical protein
MLSTASLAVPQNGHLFDRAAVVHCTETLSVNHPFFGQDFTKNFVGNSLHWTSTTETYNSKKDSTMKRAWEHHNSRRLHQPPVPG